MGTDIHLEAERQLDNGSWERIPHGEEPCHMCSTYNRATGNYENPRGWFHPWVEPNEVSPEDKILDTSPNGLVQVDRRKPCRWCKETGKDYPQWLGDRNYDVFSILGNVRNGYGFAGTITSSGFPYISDKRGLPDDLSQEIRDRLDLFDNEDDEEGSLYDKLESEPEGCWSLGDHSQSWVLLSEIDEYDWEGGVVKEGWVDPWNFELWRQNGKPNDWSGGVSGSNVEHISDTQMAAMIDSGDIVFEGDEPEPGSWDHRRYSTSLQRAMGDWDLPEGSVGAGIRNAQSHYCLVKWIVGYRECVGEKFFETIEELRQFAPDGDASRVRLVFGFDS